MTQNKKKAKDAPVSIFAQVFSKYRTCNPENLHVEVLDDNQSAAVIFKKRLFIIKSRDTLAEEVRQMLTDPKRAQLIRVNLWLKLAYGLFNSLKFHEQLALAFEDQTQSELFQLALELGELTPNKNDTFWRILQQMDPHHTLYGNAIVIGASIYDFEATCKEALRLHLSRHNSFHNYHIDGYVEEMKIGRGAGEQQTFYIYSVL